MTLGLGVLEQERGLLEDLVVPRLVLWDRLVRVVVGVLLRMELLLQLEERDLRWLHSRVRRA